MKKKIKIPMLDLEREHAFLKKDIEQELKSCFKDFSWILGPKVARFEKKVAGYLKVKYAVGVGSGTDALVLSLRALAIELKGKEYFDQKDEIITTPFTFVATAEAIIRSGATPVFVDINPFTFNIDPDRIKTAITKNTVGILPVHLYGRTCEMDKIVRIAKEHNLFIVEDTAQAFGGEFRRKKLGTIGDCGTFSFFPSKNLGACGDAGLIATNNKRLKELLGVLRNHGQIKKYNSTYIGYNSRLDSLQAAILGVKLKYVDKFNSLRRKIAEKYKHAFKDLKKIQVPETLDTGARVSDSEFNHVYHLYTIKVFSQRDELLKFLNSAGIGARIYYPIALNEMEAFKGCKIKGGLRNVRDLCGKVLTLPMHPFLKQKEIDYTVDTIRKFFTV
ncbi:MAG: DegT/DnrJ/EryC1/StrS family aminotransferase [Candidatus Omnitrophica bacterium]|nr:DegT/DnrJ/EryC1/StrS family aminotransferase [Candidatus Omnitrophota bacterium]